jgi:hypothetical protein
MSDSKGKPPSDGPEDEDRGAILARRAAFVAAALATMGVAACDHTSGPIPTLEPPSTSDASSTAPMPCLSVARPVEPEPDAALPNPEPSAAPAPCLSQRPPQHLDAGRAASPQPCLKPVPPKPPKPVPAPCLSVAPATPGDDDR